MTPSRDLETGLESAAEAAARDVVIQYVGFWPRVGAALIDTLLLGLLVSPALYALYGEAYFTDSDTLFWGIGDLIFSYLLPAIAVILFWFFRSATPGKMLIGARIVDARSFGKPSTGQLIGRYLGYYVSTIPFGLGLLWVAFDRRKQGWHDKLAKTVVIRDA